MPDDDEPWLAEAAMHRILRRTLPAQRHEVLGALSALKLQLAVARRRALRASDAARHGGSDGVDSPDSADAPASRLAALDAMAEQQLAGQNALTLLRLWDGVTVQRRPLAEVLDQCLAWTRQAAALQGHRLADSVPAAGSPAPAVQVPAAHHLVLALLYQWLDSAATPQVVEPRLAHDGQAWRLWLDTSERTDGLAAPAPGMGATDTLAPATPAGHAAPRITQAMLLALATHLSSADGDWQVQGAGGGGAITALRYAPRAA